MAIPKEVIDKLWKDGKIQGVIKDALPDDMDIKSDGNSIPSESSIRKGDHRIKEVHVTIPKALDSKTKASAFVAGYKVGKFVVSKNKRKKIRKALSREL